MTRSSTSHERVPSNGPSANSRLPTSPLSPQREQNRPQHTTQCSLLEDHGATLTGCAVCGRWGGVAGGADKTSEVTDTYAMDGASPGEVKLGRQTFPVRG